MCAKPKIMCGEPRFFVCEHCNNLIIETRGENADFNISCCGEAMKELIASIADDSKSEHLAEATLTGDFKINTITARIGKGKHPNTKEHHIEWVYLRTFQGGQLKFLESTKYPQLSFSLSDEDAHRYCDIPVCRSGKGCNFNCKRGFFAYVYCSIDGLWRTKLL